MTKCNESTMSLIQKCNDFIYMMLRKQNSKDRKQISGCCEETGYKTALETPLDDRNILYLDCNDG